MGGANKEEEAGRRRYGLAGVGGWEFTARREGAGLRKRLGLFQTQEEREGRHSAFRIDFGQVGSRQAQHPDHQAGLAATHRQTAQGLPQATHYSALL